MTWAIPCIPIHMMILPQQTDATHRAWLLQTLRAIADDVYLPHVLYFKGGTCAALLGWLDRFSVDLDFDYMGSTDDIIKTRASLEGIFAKLDLTIKDSSSKGIQYFLKYKNSRRTTLKFDSGFPVPQANTYAPQRLIDIDRILTCQTKETMFANKLVALSSRRHVVGRDVYDVCYFFTNGYSYNAAVLRERGNENILHFFKNLYSFVEQEVTDTLIREDLSPLLPYDLFARARKTLKQETLLCIRDEIARLSA